jgi:hypothetical protein
LSEQPGGDTTPPVAVRHVQVADVCPPPVPGQALAVLEDLHPDVTSHLVIAYRGQPGAVEADRPPDAKPGQGRLGRSRHVLDPDQVHHLGVPGVAETGPLIERADVRPLFGNTVDARRGQLAARVEAADAPFLQLADAGGHEQLRGSCRVRPVCVRAGRPFWPEHQPADLPAVPVGRTDAFVGRVPEQVRRRGDPVVLDGDQRRPLAHPGIDDELAGLAFQLAEHRGHGHAHTGDDGREVRVYQAGQLIPVASAERAYLDSGHDGPPA